MAFTSSFDAALFTVTTRVEDSGGDAEEPLEVVDRDRAVKDLKASSAKAILNELILFPNGVPIDSLHLLTEGIFKLLLTLWCDSSNKDCPFYIGNRFYIRHPAYQYLSIL